MPSSDTQFKPGHSGNGGRPRGARNKLSTLFLQTLSDDFEKHGMEAVERMRNESPSQYNNVIAKLMPKLMELSGPDESPLSLAIEFVSTKKD